MNDLYGWIYKPEWLQEELHWQFYTNDVANRVSIVYGKNGSGKTTFSDAVNFYWESRQNRLLLIQLLSI